MAQLIAPSIFDELQIGDLEGQVELEENRLRDTWEDILNSNPPSKGLEQDILAGIDESWFETMERHNMASPDSGIDIDLNLDEVMTTVNDPVLSIPGMELDIHEEEVENVKVISLELPVINPEDIQARVDATFEDIQIGESEGIDFEHEIEEGAEEVQDPNKIHSYSVLTAQNSKSRIKRITKSAAKSPRIEPHSQVYRVKTPKGKFKATVTQQKRKLYEQDPLLDPAAEKCRQNALNAKLNRDRKKKQLEEATTEINKLRSENEDLRTEADTVREELAAARQEIELLREQMKLNPSSSLDLDAREE